MNYSDWASDIAIRLDFGGTPVGVPDCFKAMGALGSGIASILFPSVQINHNTAWINYIWYNQQRFMNYSIGALGFIHDQLHTTSLMVAQTRFVLEQMHAPEEGVCTMIGPECCAAIPLHSEARGALTQVLDRLKARQEEHMHNIGFAPHFPSWLSWLLSGDWTAT